MTRRVDSMFNQQMKITTTYCLGFAFQGGRVLLIEKQHPEWMAGKLNGVGGGVKDGEAPVMAMVREFHEEVGIETPTSAWRQAFTMQFEQARVIVYRAFDVNIALADKKKAEKPMILWIEEAVKSPFVMPDLRWILPFCYMAQIAHPFEMCLGERSRDFLPASSKG